MICIGVAWVTYVTWELSISKSSAVTASNLALISVRRFRAFELNYFTTLQKALLMGLYQLSYLPSGAASKPCAHNLCTRNRMDSNPFIFYHLFLARWTQIQWPCRLLTLLLFSGSDFPTTTMTYGGFLMLAGFIPTITKSICAGVLAAVRSFLHSSPSLSYVDVVTRTLVLWSFGLYRALRFWSSL